MSEPTGRLGHRSPDAAGERWSFGGATAIDAAEGALLPEALIAGPRRAILHARWHPVAVPADQAIHQPPELGDVTVVDDHGAPCTLRVEAMSSGSERPGETGWPMTLQLALDPVPRRKASWLELHSGNRTATRLLPSARSTVRVGQLILAAAEGHPASWADLSAAAARRDGPRRHLDLGGALPPIGGATVRADSLFSSPGSWKLYLRATPGWWKYAEDRSRKWSPISVTAEDDRGGRYVSSFSGSTGHQDHEELVLQFLPCLDPMALVLTLTFRGAREEVPVTIDLESAGHEIRDDSG